MKLHLFKEGGDVLLVAAQAVEPFRDDHVKLAVTSIQQQLLVGRAQVCRSTDATVGIGKGGVGPQSRRRFGGQWSSACKWLRMGQVFRLNLALPIIGTYPGMSSTFDCTWVQSKRSIYL
ncbi:hypothetical protein AB9F26_19735 [Falsihalocynthiibacter sp. BN13B15]|uniref:hypothetical protein n=1 Tax=Falsihalocynthiibacter sp. BN13B15 TaxID=3240871 RepID=UPI00350EAD7B